MIPLDGAVDEPREAPAETKPRVPCSVKRELRPCEPGGTPVSSVVSDETSKLRRGGDGKLLAALFGTVLASTGLPPRMRRP
jgi:hypothetical protein